MKLIAKITLSLLLICNLALSASALTVYTNSFNSSVEADQKGNGGGGNGGGGNGGGRSGGGGGGDRSGGSGDRSSGDRSGGGGRENYGGGNRDNMGSRPPERNNPPQREPSRNEKEPLVIKREKKGGND